MKKVLKLIKILVIYFLLVYLATITYLYFFADKFIFYPPKSSYQDNSNIIKIKTADGAIISAVYLSNPQAKFTILYSHGNAVDIGELLPFFRLLQQHGFAVFGYDYHGYGTSTGKPTEKNSYYDGEAAYNYLTETLQIPSQKIILYGQSVGAGVALELASKKPVGGLILESPFITAFRTVTDFPLLPFDKYNNLRKISKINVPVLIIHGALDRTIAIWHGQKLFSMAKSPKFSLWIPGAGHDDILAVAGENYWHALQSFATTIESNMRKNNANEKNYDKK